MPSTPILKQVRESRHFQIEDVAASTDIALGRLEAFEAGAREPSYQQIARLAEVYGVAPYLLGRDALPNLRETLLDFRHQEPRPAHLSPRGMLRVWRAEHLATFTKQLMSAVDVPAAGWTNAVNQFPVTNNGATALREFFDGWFTKRRQAFQLTGAREDMTLAGIRLFIEAQRIIVNINDAPPEDFSGFYLGQEVEGTPLCFINRKISSKKAQLFTTVHEFAHARLGAVGVSNPFITRNATERRCNQFATNFLAPVAEFEAAIHQVSPSTRRDVFAFVREVSNRLLLSMHATAIRLVEFELISRGQLSAWEAAMRHSPRQEKDDEASGTEDSSGGAPHGKRVSELGYLPTYLAKKAVQAKAVDSVDVQTGMFLAESLQEKAFGLAARRLEVALSG